MDKCQALSGMILQVLNDQYGLGVSTCFNRLEKQHLRRDDHPKQGPTSYTWSTNPIPTPNMMIHIYISRGFQPCQWQYVNGNACDPVASEL